MYGKAQIRKSLVHTISRMAMPALAMAMMLALPVVLTHSSQAQTYTVIHNFTGIDGGDQPYAGLTMAAAGTFYGTTHTGGLGGDSGMVFKLRLTSAGWDLTTLYQFTGGLGGDDGRGPVGRVAIAPDGTLYGTTENGGTYICPGVGCGTVFHLVGPSAVAPNSLPAPWNETVLHRFAASDGAYPQGDLTFDHAGNIYGTTSEGLSDGLIYELTPSGGGWIETILHAQTGREGAYPGGGVIFDRSGNLYGICQEGGPHGYGSVYELSPSGSSWTEQTLYGFSRGDDGWYASGGLIIDSSGNLYATTMNGGSGGGGAVVKLTPAQGSWSPHVLYSFSGPDGFNCGPQGKLAMDAAGSLYGTTLCDGLYGKGSAFKLTPSTDSWIYTSLHDFSGGADGGYPYSNLVLDADGNSYGTTSTGGGGGVIFEITPN